MNTFVSRCLLNLFRKWWGNNWRLWCFQSCKHLVYGVAAFKFNFTRELFIYEGKFHKSPKLNRNLYLFRSQRIPLVMPHHFSRAGSLFHPVSLMFFSAELEGSNIMRSSKGIELNETQCNLEKALPVEKLIGPITDSVKFRNVIAGKIREILRATKYFSVSSRQILKAVNQVNSSSKIAYFSRNRN